MNQDMLALIALVLSVSFLIGVFIYYGLMWLKLYINERNENYKERIKRKIDKLHK